MSGEHFITSSNARRVFLFATVFLFALASFCLAKTPKELSVTYCSDCVPHQFTNDNNKPDGPLIDYWKLWSKKSGIPVRFVPAKWNGTIENVRQGKVDAHAGLFYNDQRAQFLDYASPLLSSDTHVFFHKDIPFQSSLDELKAYRVGVLSGDFVEGWLANILGEESVVGFPDYPGIIAALKAGTIKVFAADTQPALFQLAEAGLLASYRYEKLKPLYSNKFHPAVAKGNKALLNVIENGMQAITPEERLRISRTWASGTRLDDPDTIIVAIDADYPPFSSIGISGEPQGLLVDLWREWGNAVGRKVQFNPGTWTQTLEAVKTGEADIHSGLFKTEERAKWMSFSRPVHVTKTALYSMKGREAGKTLDALEGSSVAAVAGTYQADYLRQNHPDVNLHEVASRAEYFLAMMKGEVAAVVEETLPMQSLAARFGLTGSVVRKEELFDEPILAGVKKGNESLLQLIEEGLDSIPAHRLVEIEANWITNAQDRFYDLSHDSLQLTQEEKQWVAAHPAITIAATPDWPPFEWKAEGTGEHLGISAEMMRMAAEKAGLTVQPVFGTWNDLLEKLKNKQLDVAPGLNKTPDREEFLLFTEPFVEYFSVIYTSNTSEDIKTLDDLSGKTISVEEGYALAEILARDHPDITLKTVSSTRQALQLLSSGDVDAYIGNQLVGNFLIKKYLLENIKTVGFYNKIPGMFRFGIRKDWPLLQSILNKAVLSISENERGAIIKKYTGVDTSSEKRISMTDHEREWIRNHSTIRLGIDSNWAPFEYIGENGEYSGLAAGFVDVLSDRLGLELAPNPEIGWADALRSIEAGEDRIDVLPAAAATPERRKYLNFTKPYLTFPLVISTRKDAGFVNGLDDLAGKRVGVVEGYYTHELLKANYPEITPVFTATVAEGLQMLARGEIDAYFDNLAVISYDLERLGLDDIKVAASTDHKVELSMAVRKDWPELVTLLDKALDTIDAKERSIIRNTWLALQISLGTDIKTILMWAIPAGLGAILVIVAIVLWNRRLGREVSARKIAEEEMRKSEQHFRSLLATAAEGFWQIDNETVTLDVNDAMSNIMGRPREEILGKPMAFFLDEENRRVVREQIKRREKGESGSYELSISRPDGSQVPTLLHAAPIFNEQGQKIGSFSMVTDITERMAAERVLAETVSSLDDKNQMLEDLSSKLAKYLSPQVYASIFSGSQDAALYTKRKKLTVFFSDIKDFTQTTEDMQPEDLTALINSYFVEMSAIALDYGATIDKFIGDAMLMFFGDPESQGVKKDAETCVQMAVAMQKRMLELKEQWKSLGYNKPFQMRIGINTGYCNVGNFGSETRMDYTIIGGEVNLAARLESQSDPGGVLLSPETNALVQDIVVTEERAPIAAKGIRKEIIPYAVLSLRAEGKATTEEERIIQVADEGFSLTVELDALLPEKKNVLLGHLNDIAERLGKE